MITFSEGHVAACLDEHHLKTSISRSLCAQSSLVRNRLSSPWNKNAHTIHHLKASKYIRLRHSRSNPWGRLSGQLTVTAVLSVSCWSDVPVTAITYYRLPIANIWSGQPTQNVLYNKTLCTNRNDTQGLSCCHCKGVQNSYNPLPRVCGKIQLLGLGFASASYCILPAAFGSGL